MGQHAKRDYQLQLRVEANTQQTVRELQSVTQQLEAMQRAYNQMSHQTVNALSNINHTLHDNSNASDSAAESAVQLGLTYHQANAIFQRTIEIFSAMVDQVYELDSAFTEFKKVSDLSGQALENYGDKLGEAGLKVGRLKSEMIEAATQFRKSGFNDADSAQLAEVASQFQNIADTQISASDAAASIVSQIRAFGWGAEEATHIIDAYNKVANNFSVGTNDLIR